MVSSIFGGGQTPPSVAPVYDPFSGERPYYQQMLKGLYENPSSITSTPGYQFGLNQGTQALNRTYAATGQAESGAQAIGLQNYGQGYAANALNSAESNLAQLSGATTGPMNQSVNNYGQQNAMNNAAAVGLAGYGAYNAIGGSAGLSSFIGASNGGVLGGGSGLLGAVSNFFTF